MARSLESSKRLAFNVMKKGARKNNKFWDLSYENFIEIVGKNCIYCGRHPANKTAMFVHSGLDRMDNSVGYTLKNSAPCCFVCNRIKSNLFNFDQFKKLVTFLKKNGLYPKVR